MKRIWIFIAMMFIFSSCSVFKDITKRGQIVDFTKKYRSYFSNTELKSADAAFLTRDRIELVGLPKNGKVIAFDNYDVVPGNWEHLIIKAGTYGKIRFINKKDSNVFDVIFDETKDTIKFCFRPVDKGEIWTFDKKTDASPNVPPVIQEKYQFSDGWEYISYKGSKYYLLKDKNSTILQINLRYFQIKRKIIQGFKPKEKPR